ncbi:MAG TPA: NADH-quinone oxidoreductase subunit NuoH [Vicinamibacteria bacterium]|nr:NADH-quinone oxidoreductase subunit NuoH [Vicinamibacteria bacterium]
MELLLSPANKEIAIDALIGIIKLAVIFNVLLLVFSLMTYIERRILGFMQFRRGPNRTGPWGILQPAADGIKLFFKEELMPEGAHKFLFFAAPVVALITAYVSLAVVPYGGPLVLPFYGQVSLFGRPLNIQIADLDVGVLFIFAITALGVYGIVFAGYASNNKYALIGGLRSSAQMFSYELALGMSWVSVIMAAGSFRLNDIVAAAERMNPWVWFLMQFPAFVIYMIAACAEVNRTPFDLPEGETELVAGFHVEYSSMKFALMQMAEYINMITVCALASSMFLGGWISPLPGILPNSPLWFFGKMFFLLFVFIWLRATVPRFRYDQLMNFGWKRLIPAAAIWVVFFSGMTAFFGEKKTPPSTVAIIAPAAGQVSR